MEREIKYKERLISAMHRQVYEGSSYIKDMEAYYENGVAYGLFNGLCHMESISKDGLEILLKHYREENSTVSKKTMMLWDEYIEDNKRKEALKELLK